jgi:hypothetical protein
MGQQSAEIKRPVSITECNVVEGACAFPAVDLLNMTSEASLVDDLRDFSLNRHINTKRFSNNYCWLPS